MRDGILVIILILIIAAMTTGINFKVCQSGNCQEIYFKIGK